MAWVFDGFEDVQVPDKKAVIPKPQSNTNNLILLGFGLLAGYLLFSDEKKEETAIVKQDRPIDDLDKKVANQIPYKSNPNTWKDEGYDFEVGEIEDHGKYNALTIRSISPLGDYSGKYVFYKDHDSDEIKVVSANTITNHQRKYLANEAYARAELSLNGKIVADTSVGSQTEDAKRLHANKNKLFSKPNPSIVESVESPVAPLEIKTLDDIKTYGRGLRNLFGKSVLPPMKDHEGNASPTALAAANLGCPIPKTKKEAKELARKGTEALRKYKELKKSGIKKNDSVDFKA